MDFSLSGAMRSSASALTAERFRMDTIAGNIANANTTNLGAQDPYRSQEVLLSPDGEGGVKIDRTVPDMTPFQSRYEPGNPNADGKGNVRVSNVQPVREMVNMMGASRAYEANVQAFNSAKGMVKAALNIGKV